MARELGGGIGALGAAALERGLAALDQRFAAARLAFGKGLVGNQAARLGGATPGVVEIGDGFVLGGDGLREFEPREFVVEAKQHFAGAHALAGVDRETDEPALDVGRQAGGVGRTQRARQAQGFDDRAALDRRQLDRRDLRGDGRRQRDEQRRGEGAAGPAA